MLNRAVILRRRLATGHVYVRHNSSSSPMAPSAAVSPVLEQLQDTSKLAPEKDKLSKRDILVINPYKFQDAERKRLREKMKYRSTSPLITTTSPKLVTFKDSHPEIDFIDTIDGMNVHNPDIAKPEVEISKHEHSKLLDKLALSFQKTQLKDYIRNKAPAMSGYASKNKRKIADVIVTAIWQLKVSDKAHFFGELRERKQIRLERSDMHLLLLGNGKIIQNLMKTGVKIAVLKNNSVELVGSQEQIQAAEIIMAIYIQNCSREVVDLSDMKRLFVEKYGQFDHGVVSRTTEVFFKEQPADGVYELVSISREHIRRAKRLLLWLLDYNTHRNEAILALDTLNNQRFFPYRDSESVSWILREKSMYRLRDVSATVLITDHVARELERYSDEKLLAMIPDVPDSLESAKSFPTTYGNDEIKLNENTRALLRELGLDEDDLVPTKGFSAETTHKNQTAVCAETKHTHVNSTPDTPHLSSTQKDQIYAKLTDFSYRSQLCGVPTSHVNDPVFITTLGSVLYEEPSADSPFIFNTNIPFVNEFFLRKGVFEHPDHNLLAHDPHDYVIQLKFLPDVSENGLVKYPPVEFQIKLDERNRADLEQLYMLTVEAENNYYVTMPGRKVDMKVSCQVTGNLVEDEPEQSRSGVQIEKTSTDADNGSSVDKAEPFEEGSADKALVEEGSADNGSVSDPYSLRSILNSTSSKFERFNKQPGIRAFFEVARLDFGGLKKTHIPPLLEVHIDGTPVVYKHISTYHRRSYEAVIEGKPVEFNVVEGGAYGGRKLEVNIIGDIEGDIGRQTFEELVEYTERVIGQL